LVRFGARDYDPLARRWVSKDPIRFKGGTNLFVYAADDPVNHTDTTGLLLSAQCEAKIEQGCEQGCQNTCGGLLNAACTSSCIFLTEAIEAVSPGSICPDESGIFEICTLIYEDTTTCNYLCHDDNSLIPVPKYSPLPGVPPQVCEPTILVPVPEP
jgi:hypothetical protein